METIDTNTKLWIADDPERMARLHKLIDSYLVSEPIRELARDVKHDIEVLRRQRDEAWAERDRANILVRRYCGHMERTVADERRRAVDLVREYIDRSGGDVVDMLCDAIMEAPRDER